MVRLGFSDLSDDQALAVSVYRDWRACDGDATIVEKKIVDALQYDPISDLWDTIFATYHQVADDDFNACGVGDLLSPHEERLLNSLAERLSEVNLHLSNSFRPVVELTRSGTDALRQRENGVRWHVAATL